MKPKNPELHAQLIPLRRAIREADEPGVNLHLALGVQPVPSCLELAVRMLTRTRTWIEEAEPRLSIIEQLVDAGARVSGTGRVEWSGACKCFDADPPRRLRLWTALVKAGVNLKREASPRRGTALQEVLQYLAANEGLEHLAGGALGLILLMAERGARLP